MRRRASEVEGVGLHNRAGRAAEHFDVDLTTEAS